VSEIESFRRWEVEQYQPAPVMPVSYLTARRIAKEQYANEVRIEGGRQMTRRALYAKGELMAMAGPNPDQLDALLISTFVYGAAENIADFMRPR
jgi:hypothetical protein